MVQKKFSKGERILYLSGFGALVLSLALQIFLGASIGHYSISVEILNRRISQQAGKNESLVMQVDELTSFDNVKTVIDEHELSYQNENIVVISR